MLSVWRTTYLVSLSLMVGGMVFLSFLVAPVLFQNFPREQAGETLSVIFPGYHLWAITCALLALVSFSFMAMIHRSWFLTRLILLITMVVLSLYAGGVTGPETATPTLTPEPTAKGVSAPVPSPTARAIATSTRVPVETPRAVVVVRATPTPVPTSTSQPAATSTPPAPALPAAPVPPSRLAAEPQAPRVVEPPEPPTILILIVVGIAVLAVTAVVGQGVWSRRRQS